MLRIDRIFDALPLGSGPTATGGDSVEIAPADAYEGVRPTPAVALKPNRAAIDVGSSSVKLLVLDPAGRVLADQKIGAALGKGLPADGSLPEANQKRAVDAVGELVKVAAHHGVAAGDIPVIATAAVRNAPNGAELLARLQKDLGLARARILDGKQEAEVGFLGAIAGIRKPGRRYATLDLGGGSFQLAIGDAAKMEAGGSTQIGANFVVEKLLPKQLAADGGYLLQGGRMEARDFADADAKLPALARMPLAVELLAGRELVAVGGVSKFLRVHLGTEVVTRDQIARLRAEIGAMTVEQRVPVIQGGKSPKKLVALGVDSRDGALDYAVKLPGSTTLLLRIMDGIGVDQLRVSDTDARHALIAGY